MSKIYIFGGLHEWNWWVERVLTDASYEFCDSMAQADLIIVGTTRPSVLQQVPARLRAKAIALTLVPKRRTTNRILRDGFYRVILKPGNRWGLKRAITRAFKGLAS
ncbi:hypothetical protein KKB83_03360 [Patescibacteria group bacterium]|nr:hypothetical protein [Patescibacteria group bacterium]